jgi:hypothetical protein
MEQPQRTPKHTKHFVLLVSFVVDLLHRNRRRYFATLVRIIWTGPSKPDGMSGELAL